MDFNFTNGCYEICVVDLCHFCLSKSKHVPYFYVVKVQINNRISYIKVLRIVFC